MFTDKLPQALNEIGGISGQEAQFDVQTGSRLENQSTTLVACSVEKEGDRHAQMKVCQFMQELADFVRGDGRVVRHRNEFMRDRIQSCQDIETLTTRWGLNEDTHH